MEAGMVDGVFWGILERCGSGLDLVIRCWGVLCCSARKFAVAEGGGVFVLF